MKERRARPSIVYLPFQHNFFICQDFSKKYTSTNNRWRQNIDLSLSLSFLLWSYGSWINVLLWHNVQMDVTFVMEATLINNIKCLGSYDFHWKRNQNVQKHKVPSFAMAQVQLTPTQTLKMINQENPQVKTPNHKVSELHPILWSFKWSGGESQCWSTGANKCLRGADRQEHQSEKI